MAWVTPIETDRRDERGRLVKRYRVGWHEIARDADGQPIPRYPTRPNGPPKLVRRQETYDTREAAQDRVDEINPKIARGQSPAAQRDAGNRPLNHYAQAWLDGLAGNVKPRVLADYRANYRRYVMEPLGDKAVASITAADVRRLRADLMKPRPAPAHARPKWIADAEAELVTLSRSTVKHAFTTLRRILDVAVVDGAITANPCASVPRTRATDPDAEPFTARPLGAEQIAAVADYIGRVHGHPIYGLVVLFAAFTGLRAGELAGLNVGDLTLPRVPGSAGSVSVTRQRRAVRGGWETTTPKSKQSRRAVPIDAWLSDDLRAYLANDHPHGEPASPDYDPSAPLFPGRYGMTEPLPGGFSRDEIEPVRPRIADADARVIRRTGEPDRRFVRADPQASAIRCAPAAGYKWSAPVNPAGLAKHYLSPALAALGLSHVRWHDLRHAFAVMSLSAGEHYMAVSKMLGHASYVTTLTVYADYITESDGGKAAPLRRPVAHRQATWCRCAGRRHGPESGAGRRAPPTVNPPLGTRRIADGKGPDEARPALAACSIA
jgi:integrase